MYFKRAKGQGFANVFLSETPLINNDLKQKTRDNMYSLQIVFNSINKAFRMKTILTGAPGSGVETSGSEHEAELDAEVLQSNGSH